jgi:hypothetical protein
MKTGFVLPLLLLGVAGDGHIALAQSPGAFTATGGMTTPRSGHTATLLANGKLLIAEARLIFLAAPMREPNQLAKERGHGAS